MLPLLSRPFRKATRELNQVTGVHLEEGWRRCVQSTDSVLGHATGHLFVDDVISTSGFAKKSAEHLSKHLREAFSNNLKDLKWMDDASRKKTEEKAAHFINLIGYPEWVRDDAKVDDTYSGLSVTDDSFANYLRAREFHHERTMQRRGQPVERAEWHVTSQDTRAHFNAPSNYLAFPIGLLQPPFYAEGAPAALNYGAAGTLMANEMAHGFQAQAHGDKGLWSNRTSVGFFSDAKCLAEQSSANAAAHSEQYLSDVLASNGGLKLSYRAYKAHERSSGKGKWLPGTKLNSDQLFFVSFAQVWCSAKDTRNSSSGVGSIPQQVRVDMAASNMPSYAKAFKCARSTPMNPKKQCNVW